MEPVSPCRKISVIGLGYVGLPVAVAFAQKQKVVAYDINVKRLDQLKDYIDCNNEIGAEALANSNLYFTAHEYDLQQADFHIITAPSPINHAKQPDLSCLIAASNTLGKYLKEGDIVVYESTVYPGATEEQCIPLLEKASGLKSGTDFFVGYSPERINPGDPVHTFTKICKVVAAQTDEALEIIAKEYGEVVTAGIYKAPSIKVAEAAKIIENIQRDINIALINELSIIFAIAPPSELKPSKSSTSSKLRRSSQLFPLQLSGSDGKTNEPAESTGVVQATEPGSALASQR